MTDNYGTVQNFIYFLCTFSADVAKVSTRVRVGPEGTRTEGKEGV